MDKMDKLHYAITYGGGGYGVHTGLQDAVDVPIIATFLGCGIYSTILSY